MDSSEFVGDQESGWTSVLCGSLNEDDGVDDGSFKDDDDDSLASDASSGHKNHENAEKRDGHNDHDDIDDVVDDDGENGDDYDDGTDDYHGDDVVDDDNGDKGGIHGFSISELVAQKWRKGGQDRREKTGNREPFTMRMDDFSSQGSTTKVCETASAWERTDSSNQQQEEQGRKLLLPRSKRFRSKSAPNI